MTFPFPRPYPGPSLTSGTGAGAVPLLGEEWRGLTLDFTDNTYAVRVSTGSEAALGGSPYNQATGVALDFTDNSYVVEN